MTGGKASVASAEHGLTQWPDDREGSPRRRGAAAHVSLDVPTLDADQASAALRPDAVKEVLRRAFAGLHDGGNVQPPETMIGFPDGAGDCIFYAGLLHDAGLVGMKISPYLPGRGRLGKSPLTAYTLLLSSTTGEPVLLCDSQALTTARTAATTALALDHLTRPDARGLAVIGTGPVALAHLEYAVAQHPWSDVRVWSPSVADASVRARKQGQVDATGVAARVVETVDEATVEADVVMLCTTSAAPVIDVDTLRADVTVTSVDTSGAGAHEVDPARLVDLHVYCDYRATAPVTAAEMIIAQRSGWSADAIVADLPELVTASPAPPLRDGRRYFRSTGLGIEDIAIASLLV